jgi:hypothetical protein
MGLHRLFVPIVRRSDGGQALLIHRTVIEPMLGGRYPSEYDVIREAIEHLR